MARVGLFVDDLRNRITLKVILEAKGNIVDSKKYDVAITDNYEIARDICKEIPVIVLASVSQIPSAVELMKEGVFGYLFLPFQPNEPEMMVERAIIYWKGLGKEKGSLHTKTLKEVEMEYIQKIYAECGFNKKETAKRLGIGRNTLWRKLKQYRIEKKRNET